MTSRRVIVVGVRPSEVSDSGAMRNRVAGSLWRRRAGTYYITVTISPERPEDPRAKLISARAVASTAEVVRADGRLVAVAAVVASPKPPCFYFILPQPQQ